LNTRQQGSKRILVRLHYITILWWAYITVHPSYLTLQ